MPLNMRLIPNGVGLRAAPLFLALALVPALAGCGLLGGGGPEQGTPPADVPAAAQGTPSEIAVAGSLVFPNTASLAFDTPGVVGEVSVSEGQRVTAGQTLATLDAVRTAELRNAVEQAEARVASAAANLNALGIASPTMVARAELEVAAAAVAVDEAQNALDDLTRTPNLNTLGAERQVAQAEIALDDAREFLADLNAPEDVVVSAAMQRVAAARVEIDNAQEAYDDIKDGAYPDDVVRDARNRVAFAQSALVAANRQLTDAGTAQENAARQAQDAYDLQLERYVALFDYWFGNEPTDAELTTPPNRMFDDWGIDLVATFDRRNPQYHGIAPTPDDPATRWNEITIWAWLNLHPEYAAIVPVCDDSTVLAARHRCVTREFERAYDALDFARDGLAAALSGADTSAERTQDAIAAAQAALSDARDDLEDIEAGPDASVVESAEKRLGLVEASLQKAEEDLAELTVDIDPLLVAQARANVAFAEGALADAEEQLSRSRDTRLLQDNGRKRLALANAALDEAQARLADSRDLQQEQATLAEAEVALAEAVLERVLEDLAGAELIAPFAGIVSLINIEPDDRVGDNLMVMEVTSADVVEVDGVIDAAAIGYVREGSGAVVNIASVGDAPLSGRVTFVDDEVRTERGVVSYAVRIRVDVPAGVEIPIRMSAVSATITPASAALHNAAPAAVASLDAPSATQAP